MKIYDDATLLIGHTPLVRLKRLEKKYNLCGKIYAKAEFFNPGSSVKDRAALFMINDAENKGLLKKGGTVVEPTSGNTGIGLAWICAVRGYRLILTMPETMSVERRKLAKAYGAEIVLTPGALGMQGAVDKAKELVKELDAFMPDQFANSANALAHERTTAIEILEDTDGKVDYFVSAFGSGGTVTGVGKVLKRELPDVKVIGVEPASSPLVSEGRAGKHKIQGIGANFIPSLLDVKVMDKVVTVSDEEAFEYARDLAKTEGLLCGISSGAALCAACKIAADGENKDKNIVVVFPDTGERYLSTDLYSL